MRLAKYYLSIGLEIFLSNMDNSSLYKHHKQNKLLILWQYFLNYSFLWRVSLKLNSLCVILLALPVKGSYFVSQISSLVGSSNFNLLLTKLILICLLRGESTAIVLVALCPLHFPGRAAPHAPRPPAPSSPHRPCFVLHNICFLLSHLWWSETQRC